jgi:gas vesicle protein
MAKPDKQKKHNKKKKKKGMVDKLVMGAIIGGAIGSVVGMTVAPKKGDETRKYLKDKGKRFMDEHEDNFDQFRKKAKKQSGKVVDSAKKLFKK